MKRVLLTGARDWAGHPGAIAALTTVLRRVHHEHPDVVLVHGACPRGVDAIGDRLWTRYGGTVERHPADWTGLGRRAGMARNTVMVAAGADLCLAFLTPASRGAVHCARLAEAAGIPTIRHHPPEASMPARTATDPTAHRDVLLNTALAAAGLGWRVFPLRPGSKRPAFPDHPADRCTRSDPRCARAGAHVGWEERATTDPGRIAAAWARAPFNIGIATGPSGLIVIDLDQPKPGHPPFPPEWSGEGLHGGWDMWAVLCQTHAPAGRVELDTFTVETASGGTHLYFRHPIGPNLRNTAGQLAPLIDTRAHGGYVVGPNSIIDGQPYEPAGDVDEDGVAPLPGWLAELLEPRPLPEQKPVRLDLPADRAGAYLRAAVDRTVADLRATPGGQRNRALYGAAVSLGQLVAGGALRDDDVCALLANVAVEIGQKPGEAGRTIRSGLTAGAKRPRTVAA